ncbi:hypothetical protein AOA14_10685 [Sphingopyxis terrae subsp. terrae NBRC 15098]|uniref:TIGR00341 family protein n=1 Tax=Sphingopyxis terrae subsp. terrae NBRC 15098 TaxID=1219058 RepID=A0A142VZ28_9SPHN|nr:DUF389 domain-containing protein [Sphingopyxis terrae]AMU95070.1 hypothetical protein AOA14_10685 [Sphingopyxis terrae subsp. terrae NBRC 15098]
MRVSFGANGTLKGVGEYLRAVAISTRRQLDKTGLFPDLSGDKGPQLRATVQEDGILSKSYMLMCGLSAGIAALGLLQSSSAVVIGAMLISPLMAPIASMGFGFASLDGRQIKDGAKVVAVGAAIGILVSIFLTWLSPIRNATPEIIARTEPTLLDLAIATFSGVAGAFATVWQRGATAIGVAIATALMPPLATVGYGIAVGNAAFMGGAFLLFLTNLAAISFSFALIARLSGAARPIAKVELSLRYVLMGAVAFLILATPLALTLYRVTREANTATLTRRVLQEELHVARSNIAQLEVKWPMGGQPSIDAVVIAPDYRNEAERIITARLSKALGVEPQMNIQQVVASDLLSETRAIVDTAVERTVAGIARDVPPLTAIRAELGLPVQALWVNRAERTVQVVPVSGEGWTLKAYRALESKVENAGQGWRVHIIPPAPATLVIPINVQDGSRSSGDQLDLAIWAIDRWGLESLSLSGFSGRNTSDAEQAAARANVALISEALKNKGIRSFNGIAEPGSARLKGLQAKVGSEDGVEIIIVRSPDAPHTENAGDATPPS